MCVIHEGRELASSVEVADSIPTRARGLMFKRSIPDDYALVFMFDRAATRSVHMVFVRFPIDVLWVVDDVVERAAQLSPWVGFARARADTIIELPAGACSAVAPGDTVQVDPEC